ncbi:MAG: YdeI/OmpD-associated family protein [Terriglobales bacterium]
MSLKSKSFRAILQRSGTPLKWVIIRIPFDVKKLWGKGGNLKVSGEINGFAFRTSLFSSRNGGHVLLINKRMQKAARAGPGDTAQFRLQPDTEKREVTTPPELQHLLNEDKSFRRWYDALPYALRKEIAWWITDVKSDEARRRRAEQIAERLLSTMEAEHELPPVLQVAFAREPRARRGWELMSLSRRRRWLLTIFYYRDPAARARQVEKMLVEAIAIAERRKEGE